MDRPKSKENILLQSMSSSMNRPKAKENILLPCQLAMIERKAICDNILGESHHIQCPIIEDKVSHMFNSTFFENIACSEIIINTTLIVKMCLNNCEYYKRFKEEINDNRTKASLGNTENNHDNINI